MQVTSILPETFYRRPVLDVAPDVLGKHLIMPRCSGMITEVEAYDGPGDQACHGRFGLTKRTEVMFGPAGYWYVYLIYGMYFMLNVVCDDPGYPAAVLIRGLVDREGHALDGPGKLTKAFNVDRTFNGLPIGQASGLWIEDQGTVVTDIKTTPRIGVEYAGTWAKKPYRFLMV